MALPGALSTLAACAGPQLLHEDHVLSGRVWDARNERFIGREELVARAASADIALLGEVHDNGPHHRIQLDLLKGIAASGPPRGLVLEQLDAEHQAPLDRARQSGATAAELLTAGRMSKGWERAFYEPLVAAALHAGWPIIAGNLSRESAQPVIRGGFDAIAPERLERLAVPAAWNAVREERLRKLIFDGHCKAIPPTLVEGLARSQRLRDATLADALLQSAPAVGIMGNGHARRDLGVPLYIAERNPGLSTVSIGLVEVAPDKRVPRDYWQAEATERVFDFVVFTPQVARKDPCAGFSMPNR